MADDVVVLIEGSRIANWADLEITRSMDSYSMASFTAPFESDRREFRELFRPFSFRKVEIQIDGEPIFTGPMIGPTPEVTPEVRQVRVEAYALPGVLQDCTAPAAALPLEFKNLDLIQIISAVARPFGIEVDFITNPGPKFEKAAIEPEGKIQDFIVDLAKQRGLIITNTPGGRILCWRSNDPGKPVARLKDKQPPVGSVTANYSLQDYFSEITGFGSTKGGRAGSRWTERNPFLRTVLRPLSFKSDDSDNGDLPTATRARLGRMFGNMASYDVGGLPTWRDPQGALWQPNTTITLDAPDAMIYSEYEFLVRSVTLRRSADSKSAAVNLVLPGSFSGAVPSRLPWDEA